MFKFGNKKKESKESAVSSTTTVSSFENVSGSVKTTTTTTKQVFMSDRIKPKRQIADVRQLRYSDGKERYNIDAALIKPTLSLSTLDPVGARFQGQNYRSVYTTNPLTGQHNTVYNYSRSSPSPSPTAPNRPKVFQQPQTSFKPRSNSLSISVPSAFQHNTSTSSLNTQAQPKLKIVVKKSLTLCGRNSKVPTYVTQSKNRGKVLLINNIDFGNDEKQRKGAELDEQNVKDLFKQMGFKVDQYRNQNLNKMQKVILDYKNQKSLSKYDINVVVVMSHGLGDARSDSTAIVTSDDQHLEITWILEQFTNNNCPALSDKPKIFIFQCCRGPSQDKVQYDAAGFHKPREYADMLVAYSTVPGFVSHRDPENGTWYIQTLCDVFMQHAYDTDVESLLKMVDHKLASLCASGSRQTSSYESRGFKVCYIHPGLFQ